MTRGRRRAGPGHDDEVPDDRLRLMFTCCHPALPFEARVALTLRTLAGMTTSEIARAFLVPEPTMAQRLVRAKRKIRNAGIPFPCRRRTSCLIGPAAVLAVIYLLFNEGYSASSGADLMRQGLTTRPSAWHASSARLMPDEPEALGLLALMLLPRRPAGRHGSTTAGTSSCSRRRTAPVGSAAITEGVKALEAALRLRRPGPFQLQAAIAACHAQARRGGETDWATSPRSTADCSKWRPRRWSSSTEPSPCRWRGPRGGPGVGRRPRRGRGAARLPPAAGGAGLTCCAVSAGAPRRRRPIGRPGTWPEPMPSAATSSAGSVR